MKKIIFSICLVVGVLAMSGCADFLERESYGKDETWKTQEDVMQAIYGLYHFVSPYWSEEICGRGHMWLECASDNILIGRDRASVDEIREFRMSPSNSNDVSRVWEVMYQNVAKANNIIKLVPDMNLDGSFKNQALGTALFFRGFSMLWMVPYYGDDTTAAFRSSRTRRRPPRSTLRVRHTCFRTTTRSSRISARPARSCLTIRNFRQIRSVFRTRLRPGPMPPVRRFTPRCTTRSTTMS